MVRKTLSPQKVHLAHLMPWPASCRSAGDVEVEVELEVPAVTAKSRWRRDASCSSLDAAGLKGCSMREELR
jgi:hypothetical protein